MIRRVPKPWGEEIIFAHTARYAGKVLKVRAGESLSLQYHERKEETLYLWEGRLRLDTETGGHAATRVVEAGESLHFPAGTRHRMEALVDTVLFEVSTPELDDVVRLEDRYGRVGRSEP
ncbi:MAG TPA: cupin domain-containing protein [Candidatus Polarisedimenticolia bacterium]|nr:cupin domain-containing protein [Candidatus Polarisedimenticolia bacterium]